jgi:hypothetical protein
MMVNPSGFLNPFQIAKSAVGNLFVIAPAAFCKCERKSVVKEVVQFLNISRTTK